VAEWERQGFLRTWGEHQGHEGHKV